MLMSLWTNTIITYCWLGRIDRKLLLNKRNEMNETYHYLSDSVGVQEVSVSCNCQFTCIYIL